MMKKAAASTKKGHIIGTIMSLIIGVLLTLLAAALSTSLRTVPETGSGIFVQAHQPYRMIPFLHLSIRIVPSHQKFWTRAFPKLFSTRDSKGFAFCTIGAGPEGTVLVSDFNRVSDVTQTKVLIERIEANGSMDEDGMIRSLLGCATHYSNDASFGAIPFFERRRYNCNSFVVGLLDCAGLSLPASIQESLMLPGKNQALSRVFFTGV